MSGDWQRLLSTVRLGAPPEGMSRARSEFQRDYDRVLFSGPFRRLADKTQVFPLPHDDHVHSRLTHSLEVASIGRSLGTLVGGTVLDRETELAEEHDPRDFGDCVAAACLAHDLGNPPFGHVGEAAIQEYFKQSPPKPWWDELTDQQRQDFLEFEGNAQAFRIVTRTERPTRGTGLQLTSATIGALVKYPCASTRISSGYKGKSTKKFGLFADDSAIYSQLANELGLEQRVADVWCRHPLAFLTEAADDIAYLLLDLEDGLRLRHVEYSEFVDCLAPLCDADPRCPSLDPSNDRPERLDRAELIRAIAVNTLIEDAAKAFSENELRILEGSFDESISSVMEHGGVLSNIRTVCMNKCYDARDVLKLELSGTEAIQGLLTIFLDAMTKDDSIRGKNMKKLYPMLFSQTDRYQQLLRLTDHISGMTDHYAVRLYRELRGMRYPGGRD